MEDKNTESYKQVIDDSTLSNPFSRAFKSILQKLHLVNPNIKLIGDRNTNSKGYQITSQDPLAATDSKSLKAIIRNAIANSQQRRAEKIRAKNATNTLPKYTIGKQDPSIDQTQVVSKEPAHEIIRPITSTEKAAMRAQTAHAAPMLEDMSVDNKAVENINELNEETAFDSDSSSDTSATDGANVKKETSIPAVTNMVVMAETTVNAIEVANDPKSKDPNQKRKDESDSRDL